MVNSSVFDVWCTPNKAKRPYQEHPWVLVVIILSGLMVIGISYLLIRLRILKKAPLLQQLSNMQKRIKGEPTSGQVRKRGGGGREGYACCGKWEAFYSPSPRQPGTAPPVASPGLWHAASSTACLADPPGYPVPLQRTLHTGLPTYRL